MTDRVEHLSVPGLLLCHAGPHRLAFPAQEVHAISLSAERPQPNARRAFSLSELPGKVVMADDGHGVTVDALEVFSEPSHLWPAPGFLASHCGGSLAGFAWEKELLWPVMRLKPFAQYLQER